MVRVSERDRDRTERSLRDGCAEGYLSIDTLCIRLDANYRAKTTDELDALTDDLPWRMRSWASRLRSLGRGLRGGDLGLAVDVVPADTSGRLVLGRGEGCDVVLHDPTVSGIHAELTRDGRRLMIRDLDSKNGTWVNSQRVRATRLRLGDDVQLGAVRLVVRRG